MSDAEVKVKADTKPVERAMKAAAKSTKDAAKEMASAIGDASSRIVSDLGNVVLAQGKINFSAQHAQVREFEKSSARMAVAMGRDLESVRAGAERTGIAIGKNPAEVIRWTESVQRLTYSFNDTNKAMTAMQGLAAQTGRDVKDYAGLAVQFAKMGVEGDDVNKVLSQMNAQAKEVGMPIAALSDMFEAAGESVLQFADRSSSGLNKVSGLLANIRSVSSDVFSAQRIGGKMMGMLQGDTLKYERILGRNITDGKGHVKDVGKTLYDVTAAGAKYYGGSGTRGFERFMIRSMGGDAEAGMARVNLLREAEKKNLKTFDMPMLKSIGLDKQGKLAQTDAFKRDVANAELAKSSRDLMGSSTKLGQASDALQKFAANNPLAATAASSVAGSLVGGLASGGAIKGGLGILGGLGVKALGAAGLGGAATTAATGVGALGSAAILPVLAALSVGGLAGGVIGKAGAWDWLSRKESFKDDDTAAFKADEERRRAMYKHDPVVAVPNKEATSSESSGVSSSMDGAQLRKNVTDGISDATVNVTIQFGPEEAAKYANMSSEKQR